MDKTSFKQKLLLILFGLFLTVILLEASLRIAGSIVLMLQERHNHLSNDPREYRILCLGESTTALGGEDSYPSQLEALLNLHSHQKKFTVINKGIISTTSEYILSHLDQYLDQYRPQMVIVMMGINDSAYLHGPNKSLWWENIKYSLEDLRFYKLLHLIYEHVSHRINGANKPGLSADVTVPEESNNQQIENFLRLVIAESIERYHQHNTTQSLIQAGLASLELTRRYRIEGLYLKAQSLLQEAALLIPNYPQLYQEQGELYLAQEKYPDAIKAFQTVLFIEPKNTSVLPSLARAFHLENNDNAFIVYAGYLQTNPQDYWGYIELAQWLKEKGHIKLAQEFLQRAIEISPGLDQAYVDMGAISQEQGKEKLAKQFYQQGASKIQGEYSPATYVNYALILNKVLKRHLKAVVMQYPLREIAPLKNYLGERNNLIFVENKQNFKQALAKNGFNYYFKDNFAYDFGHCTRAGNALIAQNLTDIILQSNAL